MERLAKEKIAAQSRILVLKRELAQWDIDVSKFLPEQTDITAIKTERTGKLFEISFLNNFTNRGVSFRTNDWCIRKE